MVVEVEKKEIHTTFVGACDLANFVNIIGMLIQLCFNYVLHVTLAGNSHLNAALENSENSDQTLYTPGSGKLL